jgi:hypothetical protein
MIFQPFKTFVSMITNVLCLDVSHVVQWPLKLWDTLVNYGTLWMGISWMGHFGWGSLNVIYHLIQAFWV